MAAACLWLGSARLLAAQEVGGDSPPASPKSLPEAPGPAKPGARPDAEKPLQGERLPEIYYLPDKDGNLQAVFGMGLEEFFKLYDLKNQLGQHKRQPGATIQSLSLTGTALDDRAELTAEGTVVVHESGWVRVPLALHGAMPREPATFEGAGEHFLDLAPQGEGYVVWIRGEPASTHRVKLRFWVGVTQVGSEAHLRMSMPRSAVSHLELQVPLANAVARVSEGSTLEAVNPAGQGKSLIAVAGLGGEFDLAWHAAASQVAQLPTVLEASGMVTIRVSGSQVNSEAKLTVRSSGGEFEQFQVRMPPGAEYVPTPQVGASVTALDADDASGGLYEVKLARKTAGPVDMRFVTRRAFNPQRSDEPMELAGFEVVGAVRQWGTIAVQVEGNWQVLWGDSRNVRQVDELAGIAPRGDLAAAFEYAVAPYSLTARVKLQETWVRVEGDYVVLVGAEEARLQARLKYLIRGAKIPSLEVDVPGWDVDLILPANVVNVDAVAAGQNSPLVIPLLQTTSGELEVTFEARQKIAPAAGNVALRLPVPRGQSLAPANVTVVPDDNVELLMDPDASDGLAVQSVRPRVELPPRQQEPLYLRTAGESPTLVASVEVHEQSVSAAVQARLDLDERETKVDERMEFLVEYEATDQLTLGVPRALRPDRLNVSLDGQRLALSPVRRPADEDKAEVVPMRVGLPTPRIGRCELQIQYVVPHAKLAGQASTMLDVPLVIPGDGKLTANELAVVPKQGVTVTYPKGAWTLAARAQRSENPSGLTLTSTSALAKVPLAVSAQKRPVEDSTTIEQAWIQTRLTATQRLDRAVYRFATRQPNLRVSLPAGVDLASLELEIDGRRVKPELDLQGDSRELVVPVSESPDESRLLELRYHFAERPPRGGLALECPQIKPLGWTHQFYWQLVLPSNEHVLGAPQGFAREYRWSWSDLLLERRPSLDEHELEAWIGAGHSPQSVRLSGESDEAYAMRQQSRMEATNRYLFSAVGVPEPLEVYTLSRARLVLYASLPLLACGLLLIYLPAARHPAALLVGAIVVAAAGLVDPESTVLVAQAASLGLILAIIAVVMARVSLRPVPATAPVRGSSRAMERSFTEAYGRPPAGGPPPSTATNPLVPSQVPESHS